MRGNGTNNGRGDRNRSSEGRSEPTDGTNVVRVPFGVRRARKARPERPDHWATLVLPLQAGGGHPTPPTAA